MNKGHDTTKRRHDVAKSIIGHSHVPNIKKGTYQIGSSAPVKTTVTIVKMGPTTWTLPAGMTMRTKEAFFGGSMCGDCIRTKVTGDHDRRVRNRRVCQLCGTVWPGLEPDNDRRGAIEAQKARRPSFHCSSCQDVGCALCL